MVTCENENAAMLECHDSDLNSDLTDNTHNVPHLSMDYAYHNPPESFPSLINETYPSLSDTTYLDNAASPPPLPAALHAFASALTTNLYANPHSGGVAASETARLVDKMRGRVLREVFGLEGEGVREKWDLVWTGGTTDGLRLVGENFQWGGEGGKYRYLKESHTSVVGVRACAMTKGASVESLTLAELCHGPTVHSNAEGNTLIAYPAQCNVTGSRLGLNPCRLLKRRASPGTGNESRTAVLIDAAAYVSTTPLDLADIPYEEAPDFVVCSFYKIYGHPTGLGALLIKRPSAGLISPPTSSSPSQNPPTQAYFGGGTIDALGVSAPYWVAPRGARGAAGSGWPVHERHEHGTLPFLAIVALGHAMDAHGQFYGSPHPTATALRNVSRHTAHVAQYTRLRLEGLRHAGGERVVCVYAGEGEGREEGGMYDAPGPTIAFSVLAPQSPSLPQKQKRVGHKHLETLATLAGIQLRTGGLCNTGVLARVSGVVDEEWWKLWEGGRSCGDAEEFGGPEGDKPLGVARISFGAYSTLEDVDAFERFLRRYFVISEGVLGVVGAPSPSIVEKPEVYLKSLVRYPIKSCAGQPLLSCPLTPTGLAHDREFMLVERATGRVMSQKRVPRMVLVKPVIDEEGEVLRVRAEGMHELVVDLGVSCASEEGGKGEEVRVCSEDIQSYKPSPEADEWFSTFLGIPCQLHRYYQPSPSTSPATGCATKLTTSAHAHTETPGPVPILFSNESPFSLISETSVGTVNSWIAADNSSSELGVDADAKSVDPSCFRANFMITSLPPFHEDTLHLLRIGTQTFQVLARCRRCLMICVDQETGVKMKEPFSCLARHRRNGKRRVEFGVHLMWRGDLSVGGEGARVDVGERVVWSEMSG